MFALGNVLIGIGSFLDGLLWIYMLVLFVRALVSWVSADPRNTIVRYLSLMTDPLVERVRRWLPMKLRYFPLDLAFLALLGLVVVARYGVAGTLVQLGRRLGGQSLP
jgi:YggT family protein